jgi:hypothetical protein
MSRRASARIPATTGGDELSLVLEVLEATDDAIVLPSPKLLMALVEQGRSSLDDDVRAWDQNCGPGKQKPLSLAPLGPSAELLGGVI